MAHVQPLLDHGAPAMPAAPRSTAAVTVGAAPLRHCAAS